MSTAAPAAILDAIMDVPVQFFQSAIAIELAIAGALLWQMRFFESKDARKQGDDRLPDARLRLGLAIILGSTLFGSLWAIADEAEVGGARCHGRDRRLADPDRSSSTAAIEEGRCY